jgi:hypothetical protein
VATAYGVPPVRAVAEPWEREDKTDVISAETGQCHYQKRAFKRLREDEPLALPAPQAPALRGTE